MLDVETPSTLWLYRMRAKLIGDLADQSRMTSEDAARHRRDLENIESELLNARPAPCLHLDRADKARFLEYGDLISQAATAEYGTVSGPSVYAFHRLRDAMEHRDDEEKAMGFAQTALFALALQRGRD